MYWMFNNWKRILSLIWISSYINVSNDSKHLVTFKSQEYAIRKRIGIKEIQQQFIGDVIEAGQLNMEKAEWLLKQHREQQEEIHRKYDDEISRQRMNLEEKLARRRALALASVRNSIVMLFIFFFLSLHFMCCC